jgi:hypothetical protein
MGTCRLPGQAGHRLKNFQLTNKVVWRTRTCDPSRPCVRKPHLPFVPAGIPRLPNPYPNALGRPPWGDVARVHTFLSHVYISHVLPVCREHALWHVVNVCTSYLTVVSFLVSILRFNHSRIWWFIIQLCIDAMFSVNKYSKFWLWTRSYAVFDNHVHGFEQ